MAARIKSTLKKILPRPVLDSARDFRRYQPAERALFLKTTALRQLGIGPKVVPRTAQSFLFLCYGNIMRSPMCEALMTRAVHGRSNLHVSSAGLNASLGKPAHPWAIEAAREFGISLEDHRARLLTLEMVGRADAILLMDFQNYVEFLRRFPDAKSKVFLLGAYAGIEQPIEIRDPYYLGLLQTSFCYRVLNTCIANLVNSIRASLLD